MVASAQESNLNVGRAGHGPVWARQSMAPFFGYEIYNGWGQAIDNEAMADDGNQYGSSRKRTPSPGAEVGKLGDNFGKLSLQHPTFTKIRKAPLANEDKGQSQGKK